MIFDPTQVARLHVRSSEFFGSKGKFKHFVDDVEKSRFSDINDVELECSGYGHFQKTHVMDNFFTYVRGALSSLKHIKTLKITFSGFDLKGNSNLKKMAYDIVNNAKQTIKVLWIHTSNIKNVVIDDFEEILKLVNELSHINFEEISLQFSNWQFLKRQPNINEIQEIFKNLIQSCQFIKINNQRFRLQMSGWYYEQEYAHNFLRFQVKLEDVCKLFDVRVKDLNQIDKKNSDLYTKIIAFQQAEYTEEALFPIKVEEFHRKIQNLIKSLLELMDHVKEFEVDFRNWNDQLKMKNLKKRLDNVTKKDTYEKSIVSKRIGLEDNQNENQLKMIFVV